SRAVPDFAWLVWPTGSESFFRETWERRPLLLSRHNTDYYSELFSPAEVDALIAFTGPRFSRLDAAGQTPGPVLRGHLPENRPAATDTLGLLELSQLHSEGKTLLIHAMQLRCPAV